MACIHTHTSIPFVGRFSFLFFFFFPFFDPSGVLSFFHLIPPFLFFFFFFLLLDGRISLQKDVALLVMRLGKGGCDSDEHTRDRYGYFSFLVMNGIAPSTLRGLLDFGVFFFISLFFLPFFWGGRRPIFAFCPLPFPLAFGCWLFWLLAFLAFGCWPFWLLVVGRVLLFAPHDNTSSTDSLCELLSVFYSSGWLSIFWQVDCRV